MVCREAVEDLSGGGFGGPGGGFGGPEDVFSLNSLSVRVPHIISRRVCVIHGPNPLAGICFTTLFFPKKHRFSNGFSSFLFFSQ